MNLKNRIERYRHEKEPDFDEEACRKEALDPCLEVLRRDLAEPLRLIGEESGVEFEEVEVTQTFFCGVRLTHRIQSSVPVYRIGFEGSHVLFVMDPIINVLVPEMKVAIRAVEPRSGDWLFRSGLGDRSHFVIRTSREESENFWKVLLPSPGKYLPVNRQVLERLLEAVLLPPQEPEENRNESRSL